MRSKIEFLHALLDAKAYIGVLADEHADLMAMAEAIGAPLPDDVRVISSRISTDARFTRYAEKAVELEKEIMDAYTTLIDGYAALQNAIRGLCMRERTILMMRYFRNASWDDISETLKKDRKTIMKWHEDAVNDLVIPEAAYRIFED